MASEGLILLAIIVRIVTGIIAAVIASVKGRNVAAWFFGGFFLEIIGVIIVACLSNLNEDRAYRDYTDREQHRLREQLRQERLKNEAFRGYSMGRLDAHDQALGVDTRSVQALPGGEGEHLLRRLTDARSASEPPPDGVAVESAPHELPGAAKASIPAPRPSESAWYYEYDSQASGPVSELDIKRLLRSGKIGGDTLLWTRGLREWTLANRIETFRFEANP